MFGRQPEAQLVVIVGAGARSHAEAHAAGGGASSPVAPRRVHRARLIVARLVHVARTPAASHALDAVDAETRALLPSAAARHRAQARRRPLGPEGTRLRVAALDVGVLALAARVAAGAVDAGSGAALETATARSAASGKLAPC